MAGEGGRFPVLVYVNGWGGSRWENTALMQELASHGYVVAASDQPTGVFDGVDLSGSFDTSSPAAWQRTLDIAKVKLSAQVNVAGRVLDRLVALDEEHGHPFAGRLDMTRAGIVGFSFGGATAAEAAADPRFRGVVNIDGLLFGSAKQHGVAAPYLELSDDKTPTEARDHSPTLAPRTLAQVQAEDARLTRTNIAINGGMLLTVRRALHANFSDYPLLMPLRYFTGAGPIDPLCAARVMGIWIVGFFEHALNGKPLPQSSTTPEAIVEVWARPAAISVVSTDGPANRAVLQR